MADQACLEQYTGFEDAGCTAGDVLVSKMVLIGAPISCITGESVTVTIEAELSSGAANRYDIGLWINQEGLSAKGDPTGDHCYRDMLDPVGTATSCDHTNGIYWDGESAADFCGDLYASTLNPCGTRTLDEQGRLVTRRAVTVPIRCVDSDGNGVVDTGICTSWDRLTSSGCRSALDTAPDTSSNCDCRHVDIGNLFVDQCDAVACDQLDDGCTDFSCSNGGCVGSQYSETCIISGTCVGAGVANPADPCLACRPDISTTTWSAKASGAPCDDSNTCTYADRCNAGVCSGTTYDCTGQGFCVGDGTCSEMPQT